MEKEELFLEDNQLILKIENENDTNNIALLGRALSSPIRIEILRLLNTGKAMLLSEIAEKMNLQISSTAFHLQVLKDAQLITIETSSKRNGTLKWFSYNKNKVCSILLRSTKASTFHTKPTIYHVPIGSYIDASFNSSCGISSEEEILMENSPSLAFIPEKAKAQIIWNKYSGYLTYAIPNDYAFKDNLTELNISLEICSETNGYNANYPSDITFSINDVELCTYFSAGDFGDHYGKYTPSWWFIESSKYGVLTKISIRKNGIYLNEKLVNKKISLSSLNLANSNRTSFKIEVKKDAKNVGGFNIFGEQFGEFNQGIIFTAIYR